MNIFLAGVHGAGKTYLAQQLYSQTDLKHTSASTLIKEERASLNWGVDKRVSEVNENQIALARAVERYNNSGTKLLLDGHFVLLYSEGFFIRLGSDVFKALNLEGVVLIEANSSLIEKRLFERDRTVLTKDFINQFINLERAQAESVCGELDIPLIVLNEPTAEMLNEAIRSMAMR
jgi:adenylate kinase